MIQDNQKNFSRLQMLIDVIVLAVSYISAWFLRFMGPFAYSAEQGLSFEQYMLALIFIYRAICCYIRHFTLYEPLHMQGYAGLCLPILSRQMCWEC